MATKATDTCPTLIAPRAPKSNGPSSHQAKVGGVKANLLRETWTDLDSHELRLLLAERIGRPGQYRGHRKNKLYLPLAGSSCRIVLSFGAKTKTIVELEPGPAFEPTEWESVGEEIEKSILTGPQKVGRDYSFSSFRVLGS